LSDELVRERRGNILVARLNRPDARNALNSALINAIGSAMNEADTDREIRAVVLTGTGDRAFCAGMDLRAFASGEQASERDPEAIEGFRRLIEGELSVPVIDADRAFALGLVNAVVAPDEVLPAALEFAERIAANGPLGVAATKELVRLSVIDAARAAGRLRELQPLVFGSADAKEGATAFVEKRRPVWQGR
jgi:enoyl-CoA hydratase/carnithine racemase